MDAELSLPEECARDGYRGGDRGLLPIEYRELDLVKDIEPMLELLHEAWKLIHHEDRSYEVEITIKDVVHKVPAIEATLYWYLNQGSKVHLCLVDGEIQGVLVYNLAFEGILAIRLLYMRPKHAGTKTSVGLVNSVGQIHAVVFQTLPNNPPTSLFKKSGGRENKICETDKSITWSMKWGV